MSFTIVLNLAVALLLVLLFNDSVSRDDAFYKRTTFKPGLTAQLQDGFQQSAIPTFLSAMTLTMMPEEKKIVIVCEHQCGGIGDRVRGIPFVVALAALTGREVVLDRSLLSYSPDVFAETPYEFRDDCSGSTVIASIKDILNEDKLTIFVQSSCYIPPPWRELLSENDDRLQLLEGINQECNTDFEGSYLCGAAVIHHSKEFTAHIIEAYCMVEALETLLPKHNYTVIQIRAGGSNLSIEDRPVKALPWDDAFVSDVPNMWIEAFREFTFSGCKKNVAVISDSARVLSEIRYAVRDGIVVTHCCNQPLHRDRTQRQEFFWQEVVDLFIIARSRQILAGNGNFVTLGRNWLGGTGPELIRAWNKNEIHDAVFQSLKESECATLEENPG
jgi:hypothetical protein